MADLNVFEQAALNEIDKLEKSYATGDDPGAILHVLHLCFMHDLDVPSWVQKGFLRAYRKGLHGKLKRSWNEVFGNPPRTAAQMERYMREISAPVEIWKLVAEAKDRGEPIDDNLFRRIGSQFHWSSTETKKRYAAWCQLRGKP